MLTPLSPEAMTALIRYHGPSLRPFDDALAGGRLAHAWVVYGPPGCGAALVAQHLVAAFLEKNQEARVMAHLMQGTHPDVMMVKKPEDKTGISVDAIREACSFLGKTSSLGAGRALIIAGAETMNHQAANALLKRLEEPPAGSLLILTTSALGALPITVRSRCWRIRLRGLDEATFTTCLPSAGPDSYALHSGNLDAAMEDKPNALTKALHQRYTILMDKAKRHDPSVLVDLEGYDKITALMRDVPQYHLDAAAAAVVAEQSGGY